MSDATTNVFLNHDKIVFGLLHNSHPLVWQMCTRMLSMHSIVIRPSVCVRSGPFFVRKAYTVTDIVSRCRRWISTLKQIYYQAIVKILIMEPFRWEKQSKKSSAVDSDIPNQLFLNTWSAVGPFRATQSEPYYKQSGIILFTTTNGRRLSDAMTEIRRKLVIVGEHACGKVCPDKFQCGLRR